MTEAGESQTVAIAGAGIAGLSAAIALKLEGFPVKVFEREAALAPIGAGIQLGPNATRILERWTLAIAGNSSEPDSIELRNARTGAILNRIPLWRAARARYGAPYVTLLRADLQEALLSRAYELDIPIEFNAPLLSFEQIGATVRLQAGNEALDAPLLLGADGLRSTVRNTILPRVQAFATHAVAWRSSLPLSALPAPLRNTIVIWMGPGAHLVHYPVAKGGILNGVLIADGKASHDCSPANLKESVGNWAEIPLSAIASSKDWQPWPISGVTKSTGNLGRVQLLGDAWHAMPPFLASGAVMAIEDGAEIAACMMETKGKAGLALKLFLERRMRRVWQVRDRSALAGRVYHCPQPFDLARDLALRMATGPMLLARNDWLYGPAATPASS